MPYGLPLLYTGIETREFSGSCPIRAPIADTADRAAEAAAYTRAREDRSPRYDTADFQVFYHAPTVFFISAPENHFYAPIDCGIAAQTLALAAESLGLGSVIVGLARLAFESNEREALEKALRFPEGNRFVISVAIGTPDDDKAPHALNRDKITLIS